MVATIALFVTGVNISRQIRELTVGYEGPLPWLTTETEPGALAITFASEQVATLGRLLVTIRNTGNQGIIKDMFTDGPLRFQISATDTAPDSNNVPLLLRVLDISRERQRQAELEIQDRDNPASFTYQPSLMNEGQTVQLEVLLAQSQRVELSVDGKILDGDALFVGRQAVSSEVPVELVEKLRLVIDSTGGRLVYMIALGTIFALSFLVLLYLWAEFRPLAYGYEILGLGAYIGITVVAFLLLLIVWFVMFVSVT